MTIGVGTGGGHDFAINGRFFSQPVTGVQRYAREVVRAIDQLLYRSGRVGTVLAPNGDDPIPPMQVLRIRRFGPAGGHVWEQAVLPTRWRGPLINLCNTAPVMQGDQIVCMHDANVYRMPESYGRGFRMLYQTLQPMLVRRSARIATVSHDSARQLAQHLPLKVADVAVLPNGHEHVLSWRPEAATVFDAEAQHRPFVLLLGSRAKHKNAALVLDLADVLDEMGLDLLVAGSRAGIFASDRQVEASNIRWLGRVTDDDLALLLSQALCLAFPSFTEGFGLPILEAMALGCPVVSSDRASMPEVCGDAALMASPDDPAAWVSHFKSLAASDALRGELRERGRAQAERFSWTATARGYLDLLAGTWDGTSGPLHAAA